MQAEQSWSTGQTHPARALAYWQEVICKNLLELEIETAQPRKFFGHIAKQAFGPLQANFISVSEQRVWRTAQSKQAQREGRFHLIHIRRGAQLAEYGGVNVHVKEGQCVLVDCLSDFDFHFPSGVEALVLEIHLDWLKGWLPAPENAVGRVFGGEAGWGATLASALANLTPASIAAMEMPHAAVAEQIAVMLALAVGPTGSTLTTHKRALLRRVQETIRERCHEPDLDPAAVARVLRLSRRYIHILFAAAGTTFSQELYRCRLERAQRVLRDRRFDHVGIAEIAWSCGFTEPSHFARRFRETFGVAPSRYRSAELCCR